MTESADSNKPYSILILFFKKTTVFTSFPVFIYKIVAFSTNIPKQCGNHLMTAGLINPWQLAAKKQASATVTWVAVANVKFKSSVDLEFSPDFSNVWEYLQSLFFVYKCNWSGAHYRNCFFNVQAFTGGWKHDLI